MLDKLLTEYASRFHENFPIFHFRGTDEQALIRMIEKCLKDGKPIELPEDDPNEDY